jgi:hypothetical protein
MEDKYDDEEEEVPVGEVGLVDIVHDCRLERWWSSR